MNKTNIVYFIPNHNVDYNSFIDKYVNGINTMNKFYKFNIKFIKNTKYYSNNCSFSIAHYNSYTDILLPSMSVTEHLTLSTGLMGSNVNIDKLLSELYSAFIDIYNYRDSNISLLTKELKIMLACILNVIKLPDILFINIDELIIYLSTYKIYQLFKYIRNIKKIRTVFVIGNYDIRFLDFSDDIYMLKINNGEYKLELIDTDSKLIKSDKIYRMLYY